MSKLSLRELALFVLGLVVALVIATYLSTLRHGTSTSASPNYDSLTTDLKDFPWSDIWHLCHEIDNEDAGLTFYNMISFKYDELSENKWPMPPDFLVREAAASATPHPKSGSIDPYLLEVWSDGKRVRYAFRRQTPDLRMKDVAHDMNRRLEAAVGKP